LLIVHSAKNELYKPIEARSLYEHAAEPKRLQFLEGAGHTEWMFDDSPALSTLVGWLDDFLSNALASSSAKPRSRDTALLFQRCNSREETPGD